MSVPKPKKHATEWENTSPEDVIEIALQRTLAASAAAVPKVKSRKAKAKPKKRAYNRERTKKQFTVRVDEELSKAVLARADSGGLRFTDAVEEGLWLWVQQKHAKEVPLRGRFLWNVIPLKMQKLTMRFWVFIDQPKENPVLEAMRSYMETVLWKFGETPDYETGITQLGQLPTGDENTL